MDDSEAFLPDRSATLHTAKLATEQTVKPIQMVLGPSDTGTAHHTREALLVYTDGVFDQREINVRDLEDVKGKIALKYARPVTTVRKPHIVETFGVNSDLPNPFRNDISSRLQVGLACLIFKSQATQPAHVGFGGSRE